MSYKFNIVEKLKDKPEYAIFVKGLILTGLADKLNETGPFTVFAPSNLAFSKLPEAKLLALMKPFNKENLAEIIKFHVIEGKMMSDHISELKALETLQNQRLNIEPTNFGFKVNGANLQTRNIEASNGVIHGINAVLFPAFTAEAV